MSPASLQLIDSWADSYDLFAYECVVFKGKDGQPLPHQSPHPGQLKLRKPLPRSRTRVVLKARQVGATSEIASQFIHQALFTPGTSILVLAQTLDGVRGISGAYAHVVENLPQPLQTGIFAHEINLHRIAFPRINSEICFSTANSTSMRGTPRQGCHITECAFIPNLRQTLEGIQPTCHGPLILESTANGPGTFHELWNDPHWDKVFISWQDDSGSNSTQPLPQDLTGLERQYIARHTLTTSQASWFIEHLRQTSWDSWKQEHPGVPEEAFILGGDRFFQKGWFPAPTKNLPALNILQKPVKGRKYSMGVDCASGSKNGDRSTAVVLDLTNPQATRECAVLADRQSPAEFAKQVARLARRYFGCLVTVESNGGYGQTMIQELQGTGTRLYRRKQLDTITRKMTESYGFLTSKESRGTLLTALQSAVDNNRYLPVDPRIQEEFNAFRYNDEGRPEAIQGCHDDLVIACALAIIAEPQTRPCREDPVAEPKVNPDDWNSILNYEMRHGGEEYNSTEEEL